MAAETGISWADSTFNPWFGCTRVSPGCDNCYAAVSTPARAFGVQWGAGEARRRTGAANWRQPAMWDLNHDAFLAEHGRRRRVFCASLGDVFDNEVPAPWRADLFELIYSTPNLDWLLLTKRIGNVIGMLDAVQKDLALRGLGAAWPWPLQNVWLGATVVSQAEADRDIPKLLAVPARVRFLSIEPMLGPIDLKDQLLFDEFDGLRLHQVIAGGESGPKARPSHPDWYRSLRDQCAAAGVPFLFKQWGEWMPVFRPGNADEVVGCYNTWPNGRWVDLDGGSVHRSWSTVMVDRVGKKAAGHLLDGREHMEFPA